MIQVLLNLSQQRRVMSENEYKELKGDVGIKFELVKFDGRFVG